jgi:hypothetical protein
MNSGEGYHLRKKIGVELQHLKGEKESSSNIKKSLLFQKG